MTSIKYTMHWVVFCSLMLLQVVVSLKIIAGKNEVSPDQKSTTDCITFHGEDMLMGGRQTRISIVWYGDWTKDTKGTMQLVTDFITNVDDSDYWKIVRSYGKGGSMSVDKSIHVLAPTGSSSLTQKEAINITSSAMRRGLLPDDDDTIYVFIPSKEITEVDGLCTKYCAYHTGFFNSLNRPRQFAFIGNANQCLFECTGLDSSSLTSTSTPNDPATDGMISALSHELAEALTNPLTKGATGDQTYRGWFDDFNNDEVADKCIWQFDEEFLSLKGSSYRVQKLWVNEGTSGRCTSRI